MKLLVVLIDGFQEIELYGFLGVLKRSNKISQIDFWNPDNKQQIIGTNEIGFINTTINNINVNEYDAIFIPGGNSCINLRSNINALNIIKQFVDNNKWIFSICDASNVIFEKKIIVNKKYSSYPINNIICDNNRNKTYVSVDNKYITGKCPSAAIDLGIKVIEVVFGKELSLKVYNEVYGIE